MIRLYDNVAQTPLGDITEEQLQFLMDHLEEESSEDRDYYINRATLQMFQQAGADAALVDLLQRGLGDRSDMEIRWERA